MREKRTVQSSIFHFFADHEIGRELAVQFSSNTGK